MAHDAILVANADHLFRLSENSLLDTEIIHTLETACHHGLNSLYGICLIVMQMTGQYCIHWLSD